jgi:SAM-dependent methyltransferase
MTADAATLAAYAAHATAYADDWLAQQPPTDLQDAATRHFRPGAQGGVTGDIGCGSGRDVDWLHRHGYPCVGFDASDALLAEAQRRFPERRFERSALPALAEISPRTFDNVVCQTVLMHLPRDAIVAAVDALRRILVADGTLYLSWRVGDVDRRDERGRLYSGFDASLIVDALDGMTILHSAETVGVSAGTRIHTIVARANGNAFNRKPKSTFPSSP